MIPSPLLDALRQARISPDDPWAWDPSLWQSHLASLSDASRGLLQVQQAGQSVEGRAIFLARWGCGSRRVLLWSQMHGDEPTHTSVLIDLFSFLCSEPRHELARTVFDHCALYVVGLLNPDGAARRTRVNAQHIDVNRDARNPQSPEGRLLRRLVLDIKPDFAFNLHNQNARSTVGGTRRQAAVSLLAPPLDAAHTITPQITRAKQVAGCYLRAVEPFCAGGVSRYDADFMSRAFGEWIQRQGAVTVLVEAGGWCDCGADGTSNGSSNRAESVRLVELHLLGLATTLGDIATEAYLQVDPQRYDTLEKSGEHPLFDCMVRGALLVNGCGHPPFRADLGINFAEGRRVTNASDREGLIEDLGDLEVASGKHVVEADQIVCLPGAWAWRPAVTPVHLPDAATWEAVLAQGITTLVGTVDADQTSAVDALERLAASSWQGPGNLAFVVETRREANDDSPDATVDRQTDRLLRCLALGATAAWGSHWNAVSRRALTLWGVPLLNGSHAPAPTEVLDSFAESAATTSRTARTLQLDDGLGTLLRGQAADLQLWEIGNGVEVDEQVENWLVQARAAARLRYVMTAGSVVWADGRLQGARPGRLLLSRLGRAAQRQRSETSSPVLGASCSTKFGSD